MAKKSEIEKQLYQTYLDIYYSSNVLNDYVSDFEYELKLLKKQKKKSDKALKDIIEKYKVLYGKEPEKPKK